MWIFTQTQSFLPLTNQLEIKEEVPVCGQIPSCGAGLAKLDVFWAGQVVRVSVVATWGLSVPTPI